MIIHEERERRKRDKEIIQRDRKTDTRGWGWGDFCYNLTLGTVCVEIKDFLISASFKLIE